MACGGTPSAQAQTIGGAYRNSRRAPMAIVGGFDVHRAQITFDYLDTDTGEVATGQIRPATRAVLRNWLEERFAGRDGAAFAVVRHRVPLELIGERAPRPRRLPLHH